MGEASSSNQPIDADVRPQPGDGALNRFVLLELVLLLLLLFAYAGDPPPAINEAHYLVKAKNFWDPTWCKNDLFTSSGKAHTTFYVLFGWPTRFVSLQTTAWIGRFVGWMMLAAGLQRLCRQLKLAPLTSLAVAIVWMAGVEYGDLAGEWVVGGIEAKVPAYGLILFALSEMVVRRWNRVWVLLGSASAFHVLSGGWSVVAAMLAWWWTERRREDAQPLVTRWLFLGGVISLLGLGPALALTMGVSPEESTTAARIYSYYRIKHHLLPADFYAVWYLRHGILIALTWWFGRRYVDRWEQIRPLAAMTTGAVLIAAVGMLVGLLPSIAPDLAAKLLRFYWFRLTDALVPLMFALLVAKMVLDHRPGLRATAITLVMAAIGLISFSAASRIRLGVPPAASSELFGWQIDASPEAQRRVIRDWLAVCRWAQLSSDPSDVFLTPRHQQTFKWYAERAEVVNWKDVPQDAESLGIWYRRFQEVFPRRLGHVRVTIQYSKLREYREKYGLEYMIVDRRVTGKTLPLVRVYPVEGESNETFAVYALPR